MNVIAETARDPFNTVAIQDNGNFILRTEDGTEVKLNLSAPEDAAGSFLLSTILTYGRQLSRNDLKQDWLYRKLAGKGYDRLFMPIMGGIIDQLQSVQSDLLVVQNSPNNKSDKLYSYKEGYRVLDERTKPRVQAISFEYEEEMTSLILEDQVGEQGASAGGLIVPAVTAANYSEYLATGDRPKSKEVLTGDSVFNGLLRCIDGSVIDGFGPQDIVYGRPQIDGGYIGSRVGGFRLERYPDLRAFLASRIEPAANLKINGLNPSSIQTIYAYGGALLCEGISEAA